MRTGTHVAYVSRNVTGPHSALNRGFTYLALLFALAAIGLLLAGIGQSWRLTSQREKEAELITVGHEFSNALASYRRMSPVGLPNQPQSLEELVEDKRFPMPIHHLRRLYRDPFTGQADWIPVLQEGRIVAIHSRSERQALRQRKLPKWISIEGTGLQAPPLYRHWIFVPTGQVNELQQ